LVSVGEAIGANEGADSSVAVAVSVRVDVEGDMEDVQLTPMHKRNVSIEILLSISSSLRKMGIAPMLSN
jgi:hypothetical protein